MNFLPYENIQLISPLDKGLVLSKINNQLEETRLFGFAFHKGSWKKYEGFIENDNFKFRRILKSGSNSFIPIVQGQIVNTEKGSLIKLKIRLHKFVYALLIIMSIISLTSFTFSLSGILFLVAPYLICTFLFIYESKIMKTDLKAMLKA
tara:strand:- start:54 stop:500 length:447 start_codon:yes stop_codon:yes gene_type:complete